MANQSNPTAAELAACGKMLDEKELPADLTLDLEKIDGVTLHRLIEEVKTERTTPAMYNRIHNRHNRGR